MSTRVTIQSKIKTPRNIPEFSIVPGVEQLITWIENATARSVSRKPIHSNINENAWNLPY